MSSTPVKILFIEDDLDIQEAIESVLAEENYQVVTQSNGALAWEYLDTCNELPHLILLDRNMPVMSGIEFRKKQIEHPLYVKIKTILLSAQSLEATFADLHFDAVLKKPIDIDHLLASLKALNEGK